MTLNDLKKDLAYKWKPQECKEYGATMVAFIDSRIVQDLLDDVCGQGGWQDRYHEVKGNVYCEIGIKVGDEWIWKGDCGSESNFEKEKGESSDAFKRAAVKWGIGRFLYSLGIVKLKTAQYKNKYYPALNGKVIWDKGELNALCNKLIGKQTVKPKDNKPDDDLPDNLKKPQPIKDKPSIAKKFKALQKMTEDEIACMTEVKLKTDGRIPKDLSPLDFKMQRAINIFAQFARWPKDADDVTACIEFITKMYGSKK